jgi:hypothetical protein
MPQSHFPESVLVRCKNKYAIYGHSTTFYKFDLQIVLEI